MNARLNSLPRQAGVGLVTAIFLLVVLAGLAVAMVSLYTNQQGAANLDLQGARAYQAARAGLEWGMFQQMRNHACASAVPGETKPYVFQMPQNGSLAGFTVVVTCTLQGAAPLERYLVTSSACNMVDKAGGCGPVNNPEAVRRQLEVQI